jgi:hypothetical protein
MKQLLLVLVLGTLSALSLPGQTPVHVRRADLSVPFGFASGRLITVGEYLVFLDDLKPQDSVAIARGEVRNLTSSGDTVIVETANPIRNSVSKLTFRLTSQPEITSVLAWYNETPQPSQTKPADGSPEIQTYQVRHDHLIGGCNGRLIVETNRLVFESITDIDHSRQWSLRDIKELKRENPYGIKIVPFSGETYNLSIEGRGMDSAVYQALVDRITAARASQ